MESAPEPEPLYAKGAHGGALHGLAWSREGIPLVLLHGFAGDAHVWDDFAPAVAPYYRTLALDLRGHGDSDWDPQGRYDEDSFVADLESASAELGIRRLVLVAHSLGGRIATRFAGRHPERMAGLVLVDIGPEVDPRGKLRIRGDVASSAEPVFDTVQDYARALARAYPAARSDTLQRMARHGLRRRDDGRYALKMDPALRRGAAGRSAPAAAEARERALARALWDALAALPCPALVVRGAASDILSPDVAERMAFDVIPNGRLAVVPRAGHSVMIDNPEGFRDAVCDFVLA